MWHVIVQSHSLISPAAHITSRRLSQPLTRCLMYISWQRCCCEDVEVIHDCGDSSYSISETRWSELRAVGRHCVVCVFINSIYGVWGWVGDVTWSCGFVDWWVCAVRTVPTIVKPECVCVSVCGLVCVGIPADICVCSRNGVYFWSQVATSWFK